MAYLTESSQSQWRGCKIDVRLMGRGHLGTGPGPAKAQSATPGKSAIVDIDLNMPTHAGIKAFGRSAFGRCNAPVARYAD